MKKILALLVFTGIISLLISCDEETEEKLNQQQKATITLVNGSPWEVKEIIQQPNNNIILSELKELKLYFESEGSGNNIKPGKFIARGADIFLSSTAEATWHWSNNDINSIQLNHSSTDQLKNISFRPTLENASEVSITFTMQASAGKVNSISGEYTIIFN